MVNSSCIGERTLSILMDPYIWVPGAGSMTKPPPETVVYLRPTKLDYFHKYENHTFGLFYLRLS